MNSSNVCFVNEADSQEDFSSLTLTQAFSVGSVFSVDLLDSLMAAVSRQNRTQRPSTKLHPIAYIVHYFSTFGNILPLGTQPTALAVLLGSLVPC